MFRNILLSVDGSAHSDRAIDEAIDIARADQARITILTAINHRPSGRASAMAAGACAVTGPSSRRRPSMSCATRSAGSQPTSR